MMEKVFLSTLSFQFKVWLKRKKKMENHERQRTDAKFKALLKKLYFVCNKKCYCTKSG